MKLKLLTTAFLALVLSHFTAFGQILLLLLKALLQILKVSH